MRATRTPVAPRSRRPAVAGIRRPRPASKVETPERTTGDAADDTAPSTAAAADPAADAELDPPAAGAGLDAAAAGTALDDPAAADIPTDGGAADAGAEDDADAEAKPRATTKRRAAAERAAAKAPAEAGADAPPRTGLKLPIALLVAAALLFGGGAWALLRADQVTANANVAMVDTAGTADVTRQVREGLERIFSYRHDDTAATETAARDLLTGAASEQYERLFRQVREQAPAQELTLATRVVSSGVVSLRGDTAVLLVFLDQSAVRGDNGEATTAGAQLSVTAVLADGKWRISELVPR